MIVAWRVQYTSDHLQQVITTVPYASLDGAAGVVRSLLEMGCLVELIWFQMEDGKVLRQWKFSSQEEVDKALKPLMVFL